MSKSNIMSASDPQADARLKRIEMLKKATDVVCENCNSKVFKEVVFFKHLSAIASETGQEAVIPIPSYRCDDCGAVHKLFTPKI